MEITLEKKDSTNANIKVTLKQEDYQPKVQEKLKEHTKKAQIKGFRPGKVPPALIQKMYGKSILVDEINQLLAGSLTNYIKENNLPIIGEPLPDSSKNESVDWELQKEFVFNYNVGLVPEFKYELSKNISLNKYLIDVDDKIINETLENLKNQFGLTTEVDIVGSEDTIKGEIKEGSEHKEITLILSKATQAGKEIFKNKAKGDIVSFELNTLFDDKAVLAHALGTSLEEAEKKNGQVQFQINGILRNEKAIINQEFFDKIFGKDVVKSEADFLSKLTETITENYVRETEFLLKRDVQKKLVSDTDIELPNEFLKKWLLISNQGKITEEQIEKEYDFYLKELKWTLIKNRIARDHEIKVDNEEITKKSKAMIMQQFGNMDFGPEMDETLNTISENYLKQDKGNNYYKLADEVLVEKILSLSLDKIELIEKKVSLDEFKQLV